MKFSQTVKHVEELPKIQEELENRKAALNAVCLNLQLVLLLNS